MTAFLEKPDLSLSVKQTFGFETDLTVPAYSQKNEFVPDIDTAYQFDEPTTLAILAGFKHNRRVMIQGYHGTGKSTHIEQIAARLNWPMVRINLDTHITRIDLLGRDVIRLQDGKQITTFQEGLLPWALQNPVALVFDEYDAGRPDVMFVIQRILEASGKMTLLEQNRVITPHPYFRLFATCNTVGLGDASGLYHGTQQLNQAQMDRWSMVVHLNYLDAEHEQNILLAKFPEYGTEEGKATLKAMIQLANLTREGFKASDISTVMSPRTVITWLENYAIFQDMGRAFAYSFFNRCDEEERPIIAEYYQRCFGQDLNLS